MRINQAGAPPLRLADGQERYGILIAGSPGSGKSVLLKSVLSQCREKGIRFIVNDPALEFMPLFFRPGTDECLNPLDARSPYWSIGNELANDAEAASLARSVVPPNPRNPLDFFVEGPYKLLLHLLTLKRTPQQDWTTRLVINRPTTQDICAWLSDHDVLDRMLEGSGLEDILAHDAPQQRGGIHAALGIVASVLNIVPRPEQTGREWSARTWVQRKDDGCLFLTSTNDTRERLVPYYRILIDTLLMRLMTGTQSNQPTAVVLDELAMLGPVPNFYTAATELRKWNGRLIVGVQDPTQLREPYEKHADAILSSFATSIIFRLNDPKAMEWASKRLGQIEIERLSESRRDGWGVFNDTKNLQLVREVKDAALPAEIGGQAALHAYLKIDNDITKLHLAVEDYPVVQPGFIPRPVDTAHRSKPKAKPQVQPRPAAADVATQGPATDAKQQLLGV